MHGGESSPILHLIEMIFGRDDGDYDAVLNELITGSDERAHAVAINLRHDCRVSPERQKTFDGFVNRPISTGSVMDGLKEYKRERITKQRQPDFVVEELTGENIVCGGSGPVRLNPYIELVQILDLTGIYEVLLWAKTRYPLYPALADFRDAGGEAASAAWWESKRTGRRPNEFDVYIETTLEALGDYSFSIQYQPTWVTTWAAFRRFQNADADRWMEFVGVPLGSVPRWLALLKYRAKIAGTLACPTQLDAGYFEYFFPTPGRDVTGLPFRSGHAMHIGSTRSLPLLPEYIHCQVRYDESSFVACKRTTAVSKPAVENCRSRHHGAMAARYGKLIQSWMPEFW